MSGYAGMVAPPGYFTGYELQHYAGIIPVPRYWGRSFRGRGKGWRNRFYAPGLMGWQRFGNRIPMYGW